MKFLVAQSKKHIEAWKAHILCFINQDQARLDILKSLDNSSVIVLLDWAMKFIPRKYRESQADWFGKRGISWHISVAMKNPPGETLQMLTLVHLFQKCNQDSMYVLAIIDDVIEKLNSSIPGLKSISFRQDNAGCYHSAATIFGIRQLAVKHNVSVRIDFSDPQGGKGPCDRKAASIKNHMQSYLNSGHDISNAQDMETAIESNGGVHGVATVLCGSLNIPDSNPFPKWDGISLINDIQFNSEEMKVWRAYDVGNGKDVPYSNFPLKEKTELPSLTKITDVPHIKLAFVEVKPRKRQATKGLKKSTDDDNDESSDTDDDTLFTCSEDGCVKTFQRFSSLQKHLDGGKHNYVLERESFLDKAMLRYAENLESGSVSIEEKVQEIAEESGRVPLVVNMGWALKHTTTSRRLNKKQKEYLIDIFLRGEQTGQKADPIEVSKSMKKARNEDGSLLFLSEEYLTSQQITGFFSRTAAKKSIQVPSATNLDDEDDDDDLLSAMTEKELEQMRRNILNEIAIKHPITYESYNICEMAAASKFPKLSIAMLQDICKYYELDYSGIKQKRKKPYIDLLNELVASCTC